jgi:hypothetical protein
MLIRFNQPPSFISWSRDSIKSEFTGSAIIENIPIIDVTVEEDGYAPIFALVKSFVIFDDKDDSFVLLWQNIYDGLPIAFTFGVERGSQSVAAALIEQGVGRPRRADLGM